MLFCCGIFTEIEFMLFVLELFDLPSYVVERKQ